jgi:predicted amidohydrolase YtcJ
VTSLVVRGAEVDGRIVDVQIADGRIAAVGAELRPGRDAVIDAGGGALIPGLWDHHIHLLATAANRSSVVVGPPDVTDAAGFASALGAHRTGGGLWVRAAGYHESVAGDIDRDDIDRVVLDAPVRVQHRSGALWILNSAAIDRLDLEAEEHPGLERGPSGRLTGRLYGADRWLGERVRASGGSAPPDLARVGRELASYGTVGVTDATPSTRFDDLGLLAVAARTGALAQHVVAMGGPALSGHAFPPPLRRGAVKVYLADHDLPSFDEVVGWIRTAHRLDRPVAVHCVTRVALVLALAALEEAGAAPGDRIEHAAVVPPELRAPLAAARITVVTQPNLVAERGDAYLVDVAAEEQPHLYPCASLLDAGIPVAGSTDAPFGHPDPWRAIEAAVQRRSAEGHLVGGGERVHARRALELFLGSPSDPGGPSRRVALGEVADLCLLHAPLSDVLTAPSAAAVRATVVSGVLIHGD